MTGSFEAKRSVDASDEIELMQTILRFQQALHSI